MRRALKLILRFAGPHKGAFLLAVSLLLVGAFTGMLYPYLLGRLMDEVFYNRDMAAFWRIVLVYGGVYLLNQVIIITQDMAVARLQGEYLFDVRQKMFSNILSARGKRLTNLHTGDVVSRMGQDTEGLLGLLIWNLTYGLNFLISGLIAISFLFYYSVPIGLIALVLTPISLFCARHFYGKIKVLQKKVLEKNGLISSWLFEIIKGLTDIKLLAAGKNVLTQFVHKINDASRAKIRSDRQEVIADRVDDGIWLVGKVAIYIVSAFLVSSGQMLMGAFVAIAGFAGYFEKCVWMFRGLSVQITGVAKQLASIDRVDEIIEEEPEDYCEDSDLRQIKEGRITFQDVRFSYTKERTVLDGISFEIPAGKRVALVGRSGAGKTTIANLMLKIYQPDAGEILVDGKPVGAYQLHSLRRQIGIVHQDTVLFDGTVRYNLTLENTEVSDKEVEEALKKAHLYDTVMALPQGLQPVLGYKGQQLSGGQKQRLAIARIFLKNPKILIFDEATSALDSESESAITEAWDELCQGRTMLIIAHRLSTILESDMVLVLKEGKIVGIGPHEELLESCGEYRRLFYEQYHLQERGDYNAEQSAGDL